MNGIAVVVIALLLFPGLSTASGQPQVWWGGHLTQPTTKPAPRDGLLLLCFSPDGRYVLAQDAFWITVLTVQPFKVLFRAPAEDAVNSAQFTPDSRQVLFLSTGLHAVPRPLMLEGTPRLERWSIADRCRIESTGIPWPVFWDCASGRLSPEGLAYACVDTGGTLHLIAVPSGETIFQKKKFGTSWAQFSPFDDSMDQHSRQEVGDPGSARFDFSPDGRFVIAVPYHARGSAVAFDLHEKRALGLTGELRKLCGRNRGIVESAFVAPDKIMMSKVSYSKATSMLVAFPSGRVLSKPTLPPGPLSRVADPGFVRIHPFGPIEYAYHTPNATRTAAVEFSTGQVIVSDSPGLDVFGNHYVVERANGELGLYERGKGLQSTVKLDPR
jgi:hypothetical protein